MKVLSGSVPYCEPDQSNFEVGKRNIPKSTAPVIYKHNRDRELLAGAGAEGRQLQICQFTRTQAGTGTHTPTLPALLRNTRTGAHTHTYPRRHIHFQAQMCAFTFIHKLQRTDLWGLLSRYDKDKEPASSRDD